MRSSCPYTRARLWATSKSLSSPKISRHQVPVTGRSSTEGVCLSARAPFPSWPRLASTSALQATHATLGRLQKLPSSSRLMSSMLNLGTCTDPQMPLRRAISTSLMLVYLRTLYRSHSNPPEKPRQQPTVLFATYVHGSRHGMHTRQRHKDNDLHKRARPCSLDWIGAHPCTLDASTDHHSPMLLYPLGAAPSLQRTVRHGTTTSTPAWVKVCAVSDGLLLCP